MDQFYTIEGLQLIFSQHADFFDEQWAKERELYIKNYPDSELPKNLDDNFNLSRALSVICSEVERLKLKL